MWRFCDVSVCMLMWPEADRRSQRLTARAWWKWRRLPGLKSSRARTGSRRRWGAPLSLWLPWWLILRPGAARSPSSSPPTGTSASGQRYSRWTLVCRQANELDVDSSQWLSLRPLVIWCVSKFLSTDSTPARQPGCCFTSLFGFLCLEVNESSLHLSILFDPQFNTVQSHMDSISVQRASVSVQRYASKEKPVSAHHVHSRFFITFFYCE